MQWSVKLQPVEPQFNDLRYNDIPGLTMGMFNDKYNKTNFYYINNSYYQLFCLLKNTLDVALVIHLTINYKFIR